MPQVTMPDGTVVEMPDQLDADTASRLRSMQQSVARTELQANPTQSAGPTSRHRMPYTGYENAGMGGLAAGADLAGGALVSGSRAVLGGLGRLGGLAGQTFMPGVTPDKAQAAAESILPEYKYSSPEADQVAKDVSAEVAPIGRGLSRAKEAIASVSPLAAETLAQTGKNAMAAATVAPVLSSGTSIVRGGLERSAARKAASTAAVTDPVQTAEASGFLIRPSDAATVPGAAKPGALARATEYAAGHEHTAPTFIEKNLTRTNDLIAQDIGLAPGTPLSEQALEAAKAPHFQTYTKVAESVPAMPLSSETRAAIADAGKVGASVRPLSAAAQKEIADILAAPGMNGSQLVDTISELRRKGFKASLSDNPDTLGVGETQLAIARALEAQLDSGVALHNPSLVGKYQDARRMLAKVNLAENSLVGRNIDPQAYRRLAGKTSGLDGNARIVAEVAENFPDVMKLRVPQDTSRNTLYAATAQLAHKPFAAGLARTRGQSRIISPETNPRLSKYFPRAGKAPVQADAFGPHMDLSAPPGNVGNLPSPAMPSRQPDMFGPDLNLKTPGKVGAAPVQSFDSMRNELGQQMSLDEMLGQDRRGGLNPSMEPTSGLALEPVQGEADIAPLLRALKKAPPRTLEKMEVPRVPADQQGVTHEALNVTRADEAAGRFVYALDAEGKPIKLTGIASRDPKAPHGGVIIQKGIGADEFTIRDRGTLTAAQAKGLIARAKALHNLK